MCQKCPVCIRHQFMVPQFSTAVVPLFPHKGECQQADSFFTWAHNEGQSEVVSLPSPQQGSRTLSSTHTKTYINSQRDFPHKEPWQKFSSIQTKTSLHSGGKKKSEVCMFIQAEQAIFQDCSLVQPLICLSFLDPLFL
ncbi:hypothetical protein AMECASPLE_022843 [Ameca splendens]|uniref:Uncharacterized protein n=1 Tax=Ameca splendens TaxID=208324 RepID=A0ABV0ZZT7_9TELE